MNSHRFEFKSPSLDFKESTVYVDVLQVDSAKPPRVRWFVGDRLFYDTGCLKLFTELRDSSARTSIYELQDSFSGNVDCRLVSPEHLSPVFLMWPHGQFNVHVENVVSSRDVECQNVDCQKVACQNVAEVPLMDGSAVPFFYGLRRAAGAPEPLVFYDAPVNAQWDLFEENADGSRRTFGHVRICPAETFEVEYVLDRDKSRGDRADIRSAASVSIYSPENLFQIFMARTFVSAEEFELAKCSGLLGGVDESCGMLLTHCDGGKCSKEFRVASEPAMHKILDLIGDLTFICPALPRVRIEITNGGHVSHRQIMERLIPYVSAGLFEKI